MNVMLGGRLGNQLFEIAHAMSEHPHDIHLRIFTGTKHMQMRQSMTSVQRLSAIVHGVQIFPTTVTTQFKGFFQSERYFDVKLIKKRFFVSDALKLQLQAKFKHIQFDKAVGIHVRRGDYIALYNRHIFNVLPKEYYEKAYRTYFSDNPVVIFSDDIEWCKKAFTFKSQVFYHNDEITDLALFSMCRHHINSCSTYSWWCSWLGEKADSINVFPDEWFHPEHIAKQNEAYKKDWGIDGIVPARWVKMPWFYAGKGQEETQ